ncbi:MAG: ABC transporter ATP-binding protein [Chlorobiaceae bacterium]|nr:ABC transporter ATP-binding protein [Chlorobiaceae bacterium]
MTAAGKEMLRIRNVSKRFELDSGSVLALDNVSMDVKPGEFVSIVGSSGCGKSTLLRLVMGLESCTSGNIELGETNISKPSAERGMVFQESRLLPWKTVAENIAFGIPKTNPKKEHNAIVKEHVELVDLHGFEQALPYQLSGGMQQRVSIARALVGRPNILLLDEPFGALDALTRIQMQLEILRIWETERKTMILVTHDIDEAIFLGDRVIVMSARPGSIRKVIHINLPRPRDRSSTEFMNYRRDIFQEFFGEQQKPFVFEI